LLIIIESKSPMQLEYVGFTDQAIDKCEEASNMLKRALLLAKEIPRLGLETQSRIESKSHFSALDSVAETTHEIQDALSVVLERVE